MKKPIVFLSIIGISILAAQAHACQCEGGSAFLDNIRNGDLVVKGKVIKYHRANEKIREIHGKENFAVAMDVEISDVIVGDDTKKIVKVWGDPGHLCRRYIGNFPFQSEWMFILRRIDENWEYGGVDDYEISVCGEYALEVKGENAWGRIQKIEHIEYYDQENYVMEMNTDELIHKVENLTGIK